MLKSFQRKNRLNYECCTSNISARRFLKARSQERFVWTSERKSATRITNTEPASIRWTGSIRNRFAAVRRLERPGAEGRKEHWARANLVLDGALRFSPNCVRR